MITSPSKTSSLFCSGLPCTRLVTSAAIRGSNSTAITFFAFSSIRTVKLPVPGPTSRTVCLDDQYAFGPFRRDATYICRLEIRLCYYCFCDTRVLEDVLAHVRILQRYRSVIAIQCRTTEGWQRPEPTHKFEDIVGSGLRFGVGARPSGSAIALVRLELSHYCVVLCSWLQLYYMFFPLPT